MFDFSNSKVAAFCSRVPLLFFVIKELLLDPPLLIISLKDDLGNNYLCFEGVVGTRNEGARLGATGWADVFLRPSSSVSGLVVSWARWISSFLLHWKHKAVASAPSEFGSGCFKPSKIRANFCYYFHPHRSNRWTHTHD